MQVVGADPLAERGRLLPLDLHNLFSGGPIGVMAMARDKGRDTQSREIHTGVLLGGDWRPVRERLGRVEVGEACCADKAG